MEGWSIGVSGSWKGVPANGLHIGVSSVSKLISDMWIGVAGAWKKCFTNAVFSLPSGLIADVNPGSDSVVLSFLNTGGWTAVGSSGILGSGNWVTPTSIAPGGYTLRAHKTAGGAVSGTMDTDMALSNPFTQWSVSVGIGSVSVDLDLTLKDSGGNTVLTSSVTLSAQGF